MNTYALLYESMLDCCDRIGLPLGLVYTVGMLALGLCFCLNILSALDLVWTLHVVHNPYCRSGTAHPQHYVYALLYGGFLANTIFARIKFSADRRRLSLMHDIPAPPTAAPEAASVWTPGLLYVLGSTVIFVVTLTVGLMTNS
jgi:hypothetical protein